MKSQSARKPQIAREDFLNAWKHVRFFLSFKPVILWNAAKTTVFDQIKFRVHYSYVTATVVGIEV